MSSSDEDDIPLAARRRTSMNGRVLSSKVSSALDRKMDAQRMDVDSEHAPGIAMDISPAELAKVTSSSKRKAARKPAIVEDSSSDSDEALAKRRKTIHGKATKVKQEPSQSPVVKTASKLKVPKDESSDSDVPLHAKLAADKKKIEKKAEKQAPKERAAAAAAAKRKPKKEEVSESDSDVPIAKKRKPAASAKSTPAKATPAKGSAKKAVNGVKKEEVSPQKGVKKETKKKIKKEESEAPEEDEEAEEEFKWWEQEQGDGTKRWSTLEHSGVLFPPDYEPLPSNVRMKYDGVPITMAPEAEEVAGFMAALLGAQQADDEKFKSNFFKDWTEILKKSGGAKDTNGKKVAIKSYDKCDFTPMYEYFEAQKEAKKALTAAEKKEIKAAKDKAEEKYTFCMWDGRKEKVGNFRIEPPGLFRGRGEHPKRGMLKRRVEPEQVTINIGKGAKVPVPPAGRKWAEVRHDNTVTWLAMWKENINGNLKYVMLAANSSLKGMSDYKKFEKARELKQHIDKIRKDYKRELKDPQMQIRQRATAMYLIDQFALRAGNEKDSEEEADTVGCCSLRFEHVTLELPNMVIFDFLGKDSIRFYNKFPVDPQVFKNLKIFKKSPKTTGDMIFDRLNPTILNKHLQSYMPGLSAKVFRTYNASWTMQQQLDQMKNEGSVAEKFVKFNEANRMVAILCNHQRSVGKAHGAQMEKMDYEIKAMRYAKLRLKRMILDLDPKQKKKRPEWFKPDEDIDDEEWIKSHQEWLIEQEKIKIEKKFAKENETLVADGQKEMKASELTERLKVLKDMKKEFEKENKTGKVPAAGKAPSVEKYEEQIGKLDQRISTKHFAMQDKENNKEVALGTSKINYIDPRLLSMFCKKFEVPIEKIFSKTLREKFKWAIESADEDWRF